MSKLDENISQKRTETKKLINASIFTLILLIGGIILFSVGPIEYEMKESRILNSFNSVAIILFLAFLFMLGVVFEKFITHAKKFKIEILERE